MKYAIRKMLFISSLLFASLYAVEDKERITQVIMLEEEPSDDPTDVPEEDSSEVDEEPSDDEEDLNDE